MMDVVRGTVRRGLFSALLVLTGLSLTACAGNSAPWWDAQYAYQNPSNTSNYRNASASRSTRTPAKRPGHRISPNTYSVTVASGDTLSQIAADHDAKTSDLAAANGLSRPYQIYSGQKIVVPAKGSRVARPRQQRATYARPVPRSTLSQNISARPNTSTGGTYVVQRGDTLYGVARKHKLRPGDIAAANGLNNTSKLYVGQRLKMPGASRVSNTRVASGPVPTPRSKPRLSSPPPSSGVFLWPAEGKILSKFGSKGNGLHNDGVNIAVAEGAPVRVAQNGVVAYVGNELKGYGNLLLVRHANGWVSAYAHNKELLVKRGQTVRKGDLIARAGQTGSVTSPQVHFELRKGAKPVDPLKVFANT